MTQAHALPRTGAEMRDGKRSGVHEHAISDLGMWIFLATETLFFGVLFFAYTIARIRFPDAFARASDRTDLLLGTLNTGVLLTSSLVMALAVQAARSDRRRAAAVLLSATAVLGTVFLAVKGVEYRREYVEHLVPGINFAFASQYRDGAQIFFWLYFVMTGFHAIHLAIGVALLALVSVRLYLRGFGAQTPLSVEVSGLYWHFVDIVWIFLFPCLYLVSRS